MSQKADSARFPKVPIPYTRIRELNVWTLSNFLSVLRVLLLPFIYLGLIRQTNNGDLAAFGLMMLAGLTDVFDGLLARKRHTISSFGKIIDPLADKICLGGIIVFLIFLRGFPVWLVALILARDLAIILVGALLIRHYRIVFPSNSWGKLYSFSLALLIAVYTLRYYWIAHQIEILVLYLEILVLSLLILSLVSYGVIIFRYTRTRQRHHRKNLKAPESKSPGGTEKIDSDQLSSGKNQAPGRNP